MLVNVGFSSNELRQKLFEPLSLQATHLGLDLVEMNQSDAMYFSDQTINPKVLTLISPDGEFPLEDFSSLELRLLLCWHKDRLTLESLRTHRHTLGNLIVIYLSRIMKLEGKIDVSEQDSMMKLHSRLTDLYGDFEKINVYRSSKLPQKNS